MVSLIAIFVFYFCLMWNCYQVCLLSFTFFLGFMVPTLSFAVFVVPFFVFPVVVDCCCCCSCRSLFSMEVVDCCYFRLAALLSGVSRSDPMRISVVVVG